MYEMDVELTGLVPMMHDRFFNPEEVDTSGAKLTGKDAWKKLLPFKAYIDKNGAFIPTDNLRMMLIGNKHRRGAAQILGSDIQKAKGSKYKSICVACIWVLGKVDPQKVYLSPRRATFDDYDERSFINATGSRSLTRRPIFNVPWKLDFIVQVTEDRIDESLVRELFDVAGLRCGVGAYGPTFGRCRVTAWQLRSKKAAKK